MGSSCEGCDHVLSILGAPDLGKLPYSPLTYVHVKGGHRIRHRIT